MHSRRAQLALLNIAPMLLLCIKLILQPQRLVIVLNAPNRTRHCAGLTLQPALAFLGSSGRTVAAIMRRVIGVPPDACIDPGIAQALLIAAWIALTIGAQLIAVDQI